VVALTVGAEFVMCSCSQSTA